MISQFHMKKNNLDELNYLSDFTLSKVNEIARKPQLWLILMEKFL